MIFQQIKKQILEAMKLGNKDRLSTLKLLSSELHNYQIDHPQMSEDEEIGVLAREAKKRKKAIEIYKAHGASDRVEAEEQEIKIIEEFLPKGNNND